MSVLRAGSADVTAEARQHFVDLIAAGRVAEVLDRSKHADDWRDRRAAVEALAEECPTDPEARRAIVAATHDPVDTVAFCGIRAVGRVRIAEGAEDLIRISGWPSNFTQPGYERKPVGIGAALTKRALLDIFGSADPAELREREQAHFAAYYEALAGAYRRPDLSDAVHVPGGPFVAGSTDLPADGFQMDASDNPLTVVELDGFWIDRTAVSNARYRRFVEDVGTSRDFAHADEPPGKDYTPAHWHDPRFNADDHPVVGVDWYDAWAFAAWSGGALPSELQWEKAARGTDGRPYPWGTTWDPARAQHAEVAFGATIVDLATLEQHLVQVGDDYPAITTVPVDSLPAGASPHGALHMSGNVWELTRTNFFTRTDMEPLFGALPPVRYMNHPGAFHVLRGGTWTSPPVCLRTDYRGKDLLTDRHFEVGFRCVYDAPPPDARG